MTGNPGSERAAPPASLTPFSELAADLLSLSPVGPNRYRSGYLHDNTMGVVFGGQFLAQALRAAQNTVSAWPAHNCSGHFLRPGATDAPVEYAVEAVRDSRSFATRRVVAWQSGKALFDGYCSFHAPGAGMAHQMSPETEVPPPEAVPDVREYLRANSDRIPREEVTGFFQPQAVEFRMIDPDRMFHLAGTPEPRRRVWLRLPSAEKVSDGRPQECLIAFLSDFLLGSVATALHSPPFPRRVPVSTATHTICFHAPARADEWLYYELDSPWAGGGLGLTRGLLYDRAGTLVASTVQEVVMLPGA